MRSGKQKGCPQCGKPSLEIYLPFCSQGCRDRDLLQWLGEGHRIPGPPADDDGHEIDADGVDSKP
jgi:endogenous inhibitor of DNA gyrase (YacG/DUF329 family)